MIDNVEKVVVELIPDSSDPVKIEEDADIDVVSFDTEMLVEDSKLDLVKLVEAVVMEIVVNTPRPRIVTMATKVAMRVTPATTNLLVPCRDFPRKRIDFFKKFKIEN